MVLECLEAKVDREPRMHIMADLKSENLDSPSGGGSV